MLTGDGSLLMYRVCTDILQALRMRSAENSLSLGGFKPGPHMAIAIPCTDARASQAAP